eukprot:g5068.t1
MARLKWFYLDSQKRRRGPLSTSAIRELLKSEFIKIDSYVWNQDMSEWKRACQVSTLQEVILRGSAKSGRGVTAAKTGQSYTFGSKERDAARKAAAAAAASQAMYYYLDSQRRQRGPVAGTTLRALFSSGALRSRTYVWKKGFSKWIPLDEVAELRHLFVHAESSAPTQASSKAAKTRTTMPKKSKSSQPSSGNVAKETSDTTTSSSNTEPTAAAIKLARKIASFKRAERAKSHAEATRRKTRDRAAAARRSVTHTSAPSSSRSRDASMSARRANTVAVTVATASATLAIALAANAKAAVCEAILKATTTIASEDATKTQGKKEAAAPPPSEPASVSFTDMLQPPSNKRRGRRTQQQRKDYVGHGIWRVANDDEPTSADASSKTSAKPNGSWLRPEVRSPAVEVAPSRADASARKRKTRREGVPKAEKWFYVDSKGDQRGPLSRTILKGLFDAKCLNPSTYVWSSSINGVAMKAWQRIRDVSIFRDAFVSRNDAAKRGGKDDDDLRYSNSGTKAATSGRMKPAKAVPTRLDKYAKRNEQRREKPSEKVSSSATPTRRKNKKEETPRNEKTPKTTRASIPASSRSPKWFYLDSSRSRQGPVTREDMESMLSSGELHTRSYVWKAPMASWKRAGDVVTAKARRRSSAAPVRGTNRKRNDDGASASRENRAPSGSVASRWYCIVNKKQRGPFTVETLAKMQNVGPETLVWRKGLRDWRSLRTCPRLASRIPAAKSSARVPFRRTSIFETPKAREVSDNRATAVERLSEIFENAVRTMQSSRMGGRRR